MANHEVGIKAARPLALPRPSKVYAEGRKCAESGCTTLLSKYNRRNKCWAHADMKAPRLRGRKPKPA